MSYILVTDDVQEAIDVETGLPAGDYLITVTTEEPLSQSDLDLLQGMLEGKGIMLLAPVSQIGNVLSFKYARPEESIGFVWAALIPLIVPILTIGAVTFGIIKLEDITKSLMPIILVAGGLAIVIGAVFKEEVGGAITKRYG